MELTDALSETFDHAAKVVAGVGPDQLDDPTPCTEWNVQTLLSHSLGTIVNMGRSASGDELVAMVALEDDRGAQFRKEADRTLAAWRARGLDGEVDVGAGPMPAAAALSVNLIDTATHSWDLARATGQDAALPDDLAAVVLAASEQVVNDDVRRFAGIAPAIPAGADATPTDRLVAFMGRQP